MESEGLKSEVSGRYVKCPCMTWDVRQKNHIIISVRYVINVLVVISLLHLLNLLNLLAHLSFLAGQVGPLCCRKTGHCNISSSMLNSREQSQIHVCSHNSG